MSSPSQAYVLCGVYRAVLSPAEANTFDDLVCDTEEFARNGEAAVRFEYALRHDNEMAALAAHRDWVAAERALRLKAREIVAFIRDALKPKLPGAPS